MKGYTITDNAQRLRNAHDELLAGGNDFSELLDAARELETLRQRVNELEAKAEMDYAIIAGDNALISGLKEELATLWAGRSPPGRVTYPKYVCGEGDSVGVTWFDGKRRPAETKLYTSAPTIPEGEEEMSMTKGISRIDLIALNGGDGAHYKYEEVAEKIISLVSEEMYYKDGDMRGKITKLLVENFPNESC